MSAIFAQAESELQLVKINTKVQFRNDHKNITLCHPKRILKKI